MIASNMVVNASVAISDSRRISSTTVSIFRNPETADDTATVAAANARPHGPPIADTSPDALVFSFDIAGAAPTRIAWVNPCVAVPAPMNAFCMPRIVDDCAPIAFIAAPATPICGAKRRKSCPIARTDMVPTSIVRAMFCSGGCTFDTIPGTVLNAIHAATIAVTAP